MGAKGRRPQRPSRGFDVNLGSRNNPFEDRWSRRASNKSRASGSSRAVAIATKLRADGRTNFFADRRIGEEDPNLPEEDKYLARLQRERSRRAVKRARFNLDADESNFHIDPKPESGQGTQSAVRTSANSFADGSIVDDVPNLDVLTHKGKPISTANIRDDYEEEKTFSDTDSDDFAVKADQKDSTHKHTRASGAAPRGMDDDDDDDDNDNVENNLFNREEDEQEPKTYQQIMSEIVAKSKFFKAERKQEKAQLDDETTELDAQLPDIMKLLGAPNVHEKSKRNSEDAQSLFQNIKEDSSVANDWSHVAVAKSRVQPNALKDEFDYERVYLELASEPRAHATERTKTDEEKDAEERARLESMEDLRLRRMLSLDLDEQTPDTTAAPFVVGGSVRKRHLSGDALEDSNMSNSSESDHGDLSSSGSDIECDQEDTSTPDGEDSPESSSSEHGNGDYEELGTSRRVTDRLLTAQNQEAVENERVSALLEASPVWVPPAEVETTADENVPFIFTSCPKDLKELQNLFTNLSCRQRGLVLTRLRRCFAVSLNPTVNKPKLISLTRALLLEVDTAAAIDDEQKHLLPLACMEVDVLLPHIHELTKCDEDIVLSWARNHLETAFKAVSKSCSPRHPQGLTSMWSPGKLLVFRALTRLFPCSDLRHPITTPLCMLLAHTIQNVPLVSLHDAAMSCFVAHILLQILRPARRFSGELFCYIRDMLQASVRRCSVARGHVQCSLFHESSSTVVDSPLTLKDCFPPSDGSAENAFRVRSRIVKTVRQLLIAALYDGSLPAARAVTVPIVRELKQAKCAENDALQNAILGMCEKQEVSRLHLTLFAERKNAKSVRLLNPKFKAESGVFHKKQRGPARSVSSEMDAQRRIRRKINKETRSAAREVRRDAEQVRWERLREAEELDASRQAKTAKAQAFLDEQRHTAKQQVKAVPISKEALVVAKRGRKKW